LARRAAAFTVPGFSFAAAGPGFGFAFASVEVGPFTFVVDVFPAGPSVDAHATFGVATRTARAAITVATLRPRRRLSPLWMLVRGRKASRPVAGDRNI
jgi:hypothetical protein